MMTATKPTSATGSHNSGWVILFAIGLLVTASSLLLTLANGPATFEEDTGVSWAEFSEAYPSVAAQFTMNQTSVQVGFLAVGLFALVVSYFGFRTGQRWAWYAMWILPGSMIPGAVLLAQSESEQRIFGVIYAVFVLVTISGLLLPVRKFFPKRT